jgi:hypothetical protein
MTYFTPVIDKYLASWLIKSTWHTDQDIEDNFWRFVIALNHYSKPSKIKALTPDDPSLADLPKPIRIHEANRRICRNHRTSDVTALKEKILLAIKRNHPHFDEVYADSLVSKLCKKAMIVLDALWFVKIRGFPNYHIERKKTLKLK